MGGEEFGNLLAVFNSRVSRGKGGTIILDKSGWRRVKARPLTEFDMFAVLGKPDFYVAHDAGSAFLYLWQSPTIGLCGWRITVSPEGRIMGMGSNVAKEYHLEQWKPFFKWPAQRR